MSKVKIKIRLADDQKWEQRELFCVASFIPHKQKRFSEKLWRNNRVFSRIGVFERNPFFGQKKMFFSRNCASTLNWVTKRVNYRWPHSQIVFIKPWSNYRTKLDPTSNIARSECWHSGRTLSNIGRRNKRWSCLCYWSCLRIQITVSSEEKKQSRERAENGMLGILHPRLRR